MTTPDQWDLLYQLLSAIIPEKSWYVPWWWVAIAAGLGFGAIGWLIFELRQER